MGVVDDLFVGLASVVEDLALVEAIVEDGADGALGEGLPASGTVPLDVQLLAKVRNEWFPGA